MITFHRPRTVYDCIEISNQEFIQDHLTRYEYFPHKDGTEIVLYTSYPGGFDQSVASVIVSKDFIKVRDDMNFIKEFLMNNQSLIKSKYPRD